MRALSLQFTPQFQVIVDLSVEDECVVPHSERLVRALARVEDAQSAVTQNDVFLVRPNPLRIRPTVRQSTDHGANVLACVIQTSKRLESVNACDATHESARFAVLCLALQAVPALGLQRNLGAVLRDKREGVWCRHGVANHRQFGVVAHLIVIVLLDGE